MQPFAAFLRGEAGFDVEFAVTGQAGLEQARLNQHHMILLDLRLPDAQGLDLLPALLQLAAAVPIIVITSFGSLELARRAGVLGAAGFVSKPMRPADLLTTIRETLDSVGGPRPKSVAEERSTSPLLRLCRELELISTSEAYWNSDNLGTTERLIQCQLARAAAEPSVTLLTFCTVAVALKGIRTAPGRLTAEHLRRVRADLAGAVRGDPRELDPAIRRLLDDLAEAQSVQMARLALIEATLGSHRSTLYRTVCRELGEPPIYWRQVAVLRQAARLLATADERISQIAYSLGYQDESSLNHLFMDHLGLPPREYRRLIRIGPCNKKP